MLGTAQLGSAGKRGQDCDPAPCTAAGRRRLLRSPGLQGLAALQSQELGTLGTVAVSLPGCLRSRGAWAELGPSVQARQELPQSPRAQDLGIEQLCSHQPHTAELA